MASTNNHGGSISVPTSSEDKYFDDLDILNTKIIGTSYLESLFGTNVASRIQMPSNGKNSSCLEQIGQFQIEMVSQIVLMFLEKKKMEKFI